jgi:hypothetical protein
MSIERILHDILLSILKETQGNPKSHFREQGICSLVLDKIGRHDASLSEKFAIKKLLDVLFEQWPKYSGNSIYPIPGPNDLISASTAFNFTDDMWNHLDPYCKSRIECVEWMISILKERMDYEEV